MMRLVLIVLLVVLTFVSSHAEDLHLQDFSSAFQLTTDNDSALYSVAIPEVIYETVTRTDLGDIRVFNADGDVVPHVLKGFEKSLVKRKKIPFFPLYASNIPQYQRDLSVFVTRDNSGTIIKMESSPESAGNRNHPSSYLFDLSSIEGPVSDLDLVWDTFAESALLKVSIDQSDNLVSWSKLVHSSTLADLQYHGENIIKRTIKLPLVPKKYLKLNWFGDSVAFMLKEVYGRSAQVSSDASYYWVELKSFNNEKKDGLFSTEFKLENNIEPEAAQVVFPGSNSLMNVQILSRVGGEKKWDTRCSDLFYDLSTDGVRLTNSPCFFRKSMDDQWKLRQGEGGWLGQSGLETVVLQLGWRRHELLFVAQGQPPFVLAFGSGKLTLQKDTHQSKMVIQALQDKGLDGLVSKAEIGKMINLGGEKALRQPDSPLPLKKWILWAVLVMGVALLAYMVRSLLAQINRKENEDGV